MKNKISNYKLFRLVLDKKSFDSIVSKQDIINIRKINNKYNKYIIILISLLILFLISIAFKFGFEFETFLLVVLSGIGLFFPLMFILEYIERKKYKEEAKYFANVKKQREKQFNKFLKEKFNLDLRKEETLYSLVLTELIIRLKNEGVEFSALSKKELYSLFKKILKKERKEFLNRKKEVLNIETL